MKFSFEIEENVDPKVIRAMLMRGWYAFKAAMDEEARKHSLEALRPSMLFDQEAAAKELVRYMAAMEKLKSEEELWKQILITFTRVTDA